MDHLKRIWTRDPSRDKKKEIEKHLDLLDIDLRRTNPSALDGSRMEHFSGCLHDARNQIMAIQEEFKNRQCRQLFNLIRGIDLELMRRWDASPYNPKSSLSPARNPQPKDKNEKERVNVSYVNEKMPTRKVSKEGRGDGRNRNDIAKVHADAPEKENIKATYFKSEHTEPMITASTEVLKATSERDYESSSYAKAVKDSFSKTSNFPSTKPAAVTNNMRSDYKIYSNKVNSNRIASPLLPEYGGNVQESSDADRKLLPTRLAKLTNLDHAHNQLNHWSKAKALNAEKDSNKNLEQHAFSSGGNKSNRVDLTELNNAATQTSSLESKLQPSVKQFFNEYSDQYVEQYVRESKHSHLMVEHSEQHSGRYLAGPIDQLSDQRFERALKNHSNQLSADDLMSGSGSRPSEPSHHNEANHRSAIDQQFERLSERYTEPVSNDLTSGSNSGRFEQMEQNDSNDGHLNRNVEQQTEESMKRQSHSGRYPVQNSDPTGVSKSRKLEPSDESKRSSRNVDQHANLGRPSGHPSKRNENREQLEQMEPNSKRNFQQSNNQYSQRNRSQNNQPKQFTKSQAQQRPNHNVSVDQNRPNTRSYAGAVSKQTSQHENRNFTTRPGQQHGPQHHPNRSHHDDFPHLPNFEQENPNSILQNMSHEQGWVEQQFPNSNQSYGGYNQYGNQKVYHYNQQQYAPNCYQGAKQQIQTHQANQPCQHQKPHACHHHQQQNTDGCRHHQQQPCHPQQNVQHDQVTQAVEKEEAEEVEMAQESKIKVDEVHDMTGHFQNHDLKEHLGTMPQNEYIALVRSKAEKFEPQIAAAESFDFMEFFIIDENLNQFITYLDKTHIKDNDELTSQKIKVIKYIKNMQEELDKKRSDD